LLRLLPLPFAEAARILGADGAFIKLSVSSACLFLRIIFGQPLWISIIKISKILSSKKQLFLFACLGERDTKKKETAKQQGNDRCVPEKGRKTKRDTNKGIKLFRDLTTTRQE